MIELSPWLVWGLLIAPFAAGATLGAIASKFVKKADCLRKHAEELEARQRIWKKIDRIYDWIASGVIEVHKGVDCDRRVGDDTKP